MLKNGLVNEISDFYTEYQSHLKDREVNTEPYTEGIFQAIGFKEFHKYLVNTSNDEKLAKKLLDEGIEALKRVTVRYAKKQSTWVRNRFLKRPECSSPNVYKLDTSSLEQWDDVVMKPALKAVQEFLNGDKVTLEPVPRISKDPDDSPHRQPNQKLNGDREQGRSKGLIFEHIEERRNKEKEDKVLFLSIEVELKRTVVNMYREQLRFISIVQQRRTISENFPETRPIVIEKLLPSKAPVEPANQFQVAVNSNVHGVQEIQDELEKQIVVQNTPEEPTLDKTCCSSRSALHVSKDAPDFSMDLLQTKKLISNWNVDKTPVKRAALRRRINSGTTDKARDIGIVDDEEYADSTTSNEPTPEREAVLKAGLDALRRARETSSFVATDVKQKPSETKTPVSDTSSQSQTDNNNNKCFAATRAAFDAFAKQTVASILKKQDEIKFEPKKRLVPTSPKQVQIHNDSFTGHDTPRQRDKQILESCSPSTKRRNIPRSDVSPRAIRSLAYVDQNDSYYERNSPQYDRNMMEKEVVRQAWLDRERDREVRRLESLRNKEADNLRGIRQEYINSQKMVEDAEKKIKSTLQPLLEKAEFISHQEKLRNDQDKKSVKRRLGEIVTETAMSKGELLAELILDDVLMETVEELQRIELEENAEVHARFESDRPNIEAVRQRLEEFEREEEEIRRRWKAFHYSELDPAYQSEYVAKGVTTDAIGARPIVFTSVSDEVPKQKSQNKVPTSTHDYKTNAKPRLPVNCDDVIQEFVPKEMRQSILAYKGRYDKYLGRTLTEKHGRFDPYKLIERISDEILEEIVADVGRELDDICDDYVENIYVDEFVRNDSLFPQTSNDTVTSKRGSSISTSISP
eukprot:gene13769-15211_t